MRAPNEGSDDAETNTAVQGAGGERAVKVQPLLARRVWAALALLLLLCGVASWRLAEESNAGFASSAALLAFVGAVAVAIERLLEMLWSLLGNTRLGGWWPLKQVKASFDVVEEQTNLLLGPILTDTKRVLEAAKAEAGDAKDLVSQIDDQLDGLEAYRKHMIGRFDNARHLAPGSARLALVAVVAREGGEALERANELARQAGAEATSAVGAALESTERALEIVRSFDDNPARRVASIVLGSCLGLLIAGFMSLNIFSAVLGSGVGADAGLLDGVAGILLTGLVLGLGASPTHEVIKALQQYKGRTSRDEAVPVAARVGADVFLFDRAFEPSAAPAGRSAVDGFGAGRQRVTRIRSTQ